MNRTISIIIPAYNVTKYLDRCIRSIITQTYYDLEIIIVDDGSQDLSAVLCDSWCLKDIRVIVVHKANGGLSDARNFGMKIASGEFIGFVDSDDYVDIRLYERLLDSIEKSKSDISCCTVEMFWNNGDRRILTIKENKELSRAEAQYALLCENDIKQPVWYKLYKRELVADILFKNGKLHEDVFWSYQAIGKAAKVSLIDNIGYFYYQRDNSIMGSDYSLRRLDLLEAKCERQKYYGTYFPELCSLGRLDIQESCIYHGQMSLRYLKGNERKKAMKRLKKWADANRILRRDYSHCKFTSRLWIDLSRVSLYLVCILKNMIKIGF